jgi:hypothetical protein
VLIDAGDRIARRAQIEPIDDPIGRWIGGEPEWSSGMFPKKNMPD